jgi:flagellar protein FlaJ
MSSVAGSGAPPQTMFKVMAKFNEYGEIAKEAGKISRNIEFFGLDEITAIKEVMAKTPSHHFRDLLTGILTTIQTGGNLKSYMQEQSTKSMFEYRLNRQRYSQTLSTYADIYTAVLIAAPLLFIVILSILGVIGGQMFGMPINSVMNVGIFILIPILNTLFLLFIHMTQPKM